MEMLVIFASIFMIKRQTHGATGKTVKSTISLPRKVLVATALNSNMVAVHGELSEIYVLDVNTGEQVTLPKNKFSS